MMKLIIFDMFGIKEIIIAAIFSFFSVFTTRLYYINKIQKTEINEYNKSKEIQENVLNLDDKIEVRYKDKINSIDSTKIIILNTEKYFNETNQLYDQYFE